MAILGYRVRHWTATAAIAAVLAAGSLARAGEPGLLTAGDAVVTGFSGVIEPFGELKPETDVIAETFINPDGVSARIHDLRNPGFVWDARAWQAQAISEFRARDVGQVFGVALDDAEQPNIYLAASSAYGLQIVKPDEDGDGRPERLRSGEAGAQWMEGMWGRQAEAGGPGSIWKIDGRTGAISLFTNVTLEGVDNPGPGLGNIAYDKAHKLLFVSDLSSGMVQSYSLDGEMADAFDPGGQGMELAGKPPVHDDSAGRLDISSGDFDADDPATWGYAEENRRVWALAVHEGRLFYAMTGLSQIWSVGLDEKTGHFLGDPRWELDVPKKPKKLPVTDMIFTQKGAMILAQRGQFQSGYDYRAFAEPEKARVLRFWQENPDDPATQGRWIAEPEEYAVGFKPQNRATSGGLDLGYGYGADGFADTQACEAALWTTGEDLRQAEDEALIAALKRGGALWLDGLQGMPAGPVKQDANATPPWASYMLDNDPENTDGNETDDPFAYGDGAVMGWTGDVAVFRPGCGGGGVAGYWGGAGYAWSYPDYITNTGGGDPKCTPGVDCPEAQCAAPLGKFICDKKTGTWTLSVDAGANPGLLADTIKITGTSPGLAVANGPVIPIGAPDTPLQISGSAQGQLMSIGLCLFNKAEMASGKPFTCCKTSVTAFAPRGECKKQN